MRMHSWQVWALHEPYISALHSNVRSGPKSHEDRMFYAQHLVGKMDAKQAKVWGTPCGTAQQL